MLEKNAMRLLLGMTLLLGATGELIARPGDVCKLDLECSLDERCFDGWCQCRLGLRASSDGCTPGPKHLGEVPPSRSNLTTKLITVVPGLETSAGNFCRVSAEWRLVRFETGDSIHYLAPYQQPIPFGGIPQPVSVSWADENATASWTGRQAIPVAELNGRIRGDSWASSSSYSGMAYISAIYHPFDVDSACIGVAAASANGIANNSWEAPMSCLVPPSGPCDFVDGPMLEADPSGTSMYAVGTKACNCEPCNNAGKLVVEVMPDCRFGPAGCCGSDFGCSGTCTATAIKRCPVTAEYVDPSNDIVNNHPSVAINPCTHRALVLYATDHDTLMLNVIKPDGTSALKKMLAMEVAIGGRNLECDGLHGEVLACVDDNEHTCGDDGQCVNVAKKPQIAVTAVGDQCYAGIVYSYASGSLGRFSVAREIWNVTDDSSSAAIARVDFHVDNNSYNQYSPEVVAAGPWIGFGYYSQISGPCATRFSVDVLNVVVPSKSFFISNLDDATFPGFGAAQSGIDYQSGMAGPDARSLVFGWNRPICAPEGSGGCLENCELQPSCPSGLWGLEVRAGTVLP